MPLRISTRFSCTIVIDGEVVPIKIKRLEPEEAVEFNMEFQRFGRRSQDKTPVEKEEELTAKRFVVRSVTDFVEVLPGQLFCDEEEVTRGADLVRLFGSRDEVLSELLLLIFMENHLSAEQKSNWRTRLAPFIPTPQDVADRMMELAHVTPDDVVYDLGCGDGRLCIAAAKRGAKACGWEIDADRVLEAKKAAEEAGVADLCTFVHGDAMEVKTLSKATVVALYLLASANAKLRPVLLQALPAGARVVSHAFMIGGDWPADSVDVLPAATDGEVVHSGQRTIYVYSVDRWRKAHAA